MTNQIGGNAGASGDGGAGHGILHSVMVMKDDAEVLGHGIQRMGRHFGEEPSADDQAVRIVERHGRQFIQFQDAAQVPQVEGRVVDDDTLRREQHPLELGPDGTELLAVADVPI